MSEDVMVQHCAVGNTHGINRLTILDMKFSSYLTVRITRFSYISQSVNPVLENSHCLLWEKYTSKVCTFLQVFK
jgi:hypothetical protein